MKSSQRRATSGSATHLPTRGARRRRWTVLVAALAAFTLIASSCASDDDSSDGGDDAASATTAAPSTQPDDDGDDAPAEDPEDEVAEAVEAGEATGADTREEADTGPVHGGRLVYGIEADTANPFVPYAASCAISCQMILRAVADPLFVADGEGTAHPYLVEPGSVNVSDDYLTWTIDIREGINFHDGTPVDGEAIAYNVNACRLSPLTGPAFLSLIDVSAEGQTVTFTYDTPAAKGPTQLRADRCGFMFSKAWMETLPNNPLLSDEQKAAATGDPANLVASGPFKFESYTPGNGNSFIASRNENYWRGPNGITGEQLPYLDEVEFVVAVDIQSRANGLRAGQYDIIHTANSDEIVKFRDEEDVGLLQSNAYGETNYVMLNTAVGNNPTLQFIRQSAEPIAMDPLGMNAPSALVHLSCRKAFAHALDRQRIAEERGGGIVTPANGPFPPGSIGYLEDTGYPDYDVEAARAEFETCKADSGQNPVQVAYNTTNDPFNVESVELNVAMLQEAFGDEIQVAIAPIEQGQYINLALVGAFQAFGWRNHGGVDPIEQWFWWHSATASPVNPTVPELAINFGRFQDPEIDAALAVIRHNPDPAARKEAAEAVNRAFGKNVWNLWTNWTLWGIAFDPRLQNLTDLPIPDTDTVTAAVISGQHHLAQVWCEEGNCQG